MIDDPFAPSNNLPPGLEPPPYGPPAEPMAWIDTMIKALSQPNETAYAQIANDPGVSVGRAAVWYTLSVLFSVFISLAMTFVFKPDVFQNFQGFGLSDSDTAAAGAIMVGLMLCVIPFAAIFSTLALMISTAIIQLIARLFGGQGSFGQLFYTFCAFLTPIMPVSALLSGIPVINCLGIILTLYMLFLQILAVKATNRFGWGGAVAAVFLPSIILIALFCCAFFAAFALLGPEYQNIFEQLSPGQL